MTKCKMYQALWGALLSVSIALMPMQVAMAGTRGHNHHGRSMDWKTDLGSNFWAFPRGMQRDGAAGPTSIWWMLEYGSVVAAAFEDAKASEGRTSPARSTLR